MPTASVHGLHVFIWNYDPPFSRKSRSQFAVKWCESYQPHVNSFFKQALRCYCIRNQHHFKFLILTSKHVDYTASHSLVLAIYFSSAFGHRHILYFLFQAVPWDLIYLPALLSSFIIFLSKDGFSTRPSYSATLLNIIHCPSSSLLRHFPFYFNSVFLFLLHFHPSNPKLLAVLHHLEPKTDYGKPVEQADSRVLTWCSCCSNSMAQRPKMALRI